MKFNKNKPKGLKFETSISFDMENMVNLSYEDLEILQNNVFSKLEMLKDYNFIEAKKKYEAIQKELDKRFKESLKE